MSSDLAPDALLALLEAHPARLVAMTPGRLRTAPQPGAWSPVEVLAHVQECADAWADSMGRILREDRPRIRYVSPRSRIGKTEYRGLAFGELLAIFVPRRDALLATLRPLAPVDWERTAIVTRNGRTSPWSLRDYAHRLATHEAERVVQIERLVAVEAFDA